MKRLLSAVFVTLALLSFVLPVAPAHAQFDGAKEEACKGVLLTSGKDENGNPVSTECTNGKSSALNKAIGTALNLLSFVAGVLSIIMLIIGGIKYATSQGESGNVNSAKNTVFYALIGIAVVATSQIIVRFVVNKV